MTTCQHDVASLPPEMPGPASKAPEIKTIGSGSDLAAGFEGFMQAFEAFKDANDERLEQIERRMAADVLTEDKVSRINQALDDYQTTINTLSLKAARPSLGAGQTGLQGNVEHKAAFETYMRKGHENGLLAMEEKAMSVGSDPDGGYLVPSETEGEIGQRLKAMSPMRALAGIRQVSASLYKKPFAASGPAVGWVGETAARPQTAATQLAELAFPTMELYAMPAATPSLLDDSAVDLDGWIAEEVETAFAEQETQAFINGDGVNKPMGFLSVATAEESSWEWGKLGMIKTGTAGALPPSNGSDVLIDLVYALKAGYRQNGHWLMNRRTQATIRKLKDSEGNYIWQPPASLDTRASLMSFPVVEAEDMPDMANDANAIAFGDFRRGYLIVDRLGIRILRDPYSAKPYVLFYTTKRVGGGVQDYDAIKLLNFAA